MDKLKFIKDKYIQCNYANKLELANFLSLFVDFTVSSRSLETSNYYSINKEGIASATKGYARKEAEAGRVTLYDLDIIKLEFYKIFSNNNIQENLNIVSNTVSHSFPRVMWVKDSGDSIDSYVRRIVINFLIDKYVVVRNFETFKDYQISTNSKYKFEVWDEAIELEDLTVLTKEDIAKLANTTVDKLKIIE